MTIQRTAVFPKTATTIITAKRASQKWAAADDILSPEKIIKLAEMITKLSEMIITLAEMIIRLLK